MNRGACDCALLCFVGGMLTSYIVRNAARKFGPDIVTRFFCGQTSKGSRIPYSGLVWKSFDPSISSQENWNKYKMLISAVVPRPIALVSSCATDGTRNCAPFRYSIHKIVIF